jgi:5-methyltetrahydrofolate--homocysteine methyltransferase
MRKEKFTLGESLRPRFSAGYGDLPLEYQKKIFDLLDPHTQIGLTLNDSYLMSPSKSVTALIGVEKIKGI